MQKIAVIGTGYVGLVSGACLSDFGNSVICVDTDKKKIEGLKQGRLPIYEPGLESVVERNVHYRRLSFTIEIKEAVKKSAVIFIAVGTPPAEDGSADLKYVETAARQIAQSMDGYRIIVDKSTVPIGTGKKVRQWIQEELDNRGVNYDFDIVSNPEFLREGAAVRDFTHPDRIVIGGESEKALKIMKSVYQVLYINETPFIETNLETAEMIKYASNAFLAMKITFINEVANLCEKVGANVLDVAKAMGRDGRISSKFLHPGPGYGGSCFPKDTLAFAEIGRKYNSPITLIEETVKANEIQKHKMVEKIVTAMKSIDKKTIAVLGLSFKPNTDDMREAPSITILHELVSKGVVLFRVFDPIAMEEAKWRLSSIKENMVFCADEYEAVKDADAIVIMTEWNQFRNLDLDKIKNLMKDKYFFDLRNIYRRAVMESHGFFYHGVGQ